MRKFIVFGLGEEEFGVDIKSVVEILKSRKASALPKLPDFVSGVITLRGEVIPLVDMRRRFGIGARPGKERIIIVRTTEEKIGMVVDEVKEIADFEAGEIAPSPSLFKGLKTEYLLGLGRKKDRVVILLDLENILTAEERIILGESAGAAPEGK